MGLYYDADTDSWYDDGTVDDYSLFYDGTDTSNPANVYNDANAADNIDVGGGWNPATGKGDQATADAAAATGVTSSASLPAGSSSDFLSGLSKLAASLKSNSGVTSAIKGLLGSGTTAGTLLPLLYGAYAASQSNNRTQPSGYQGSIPKYTATRNAAPAGQRLSGDVTFTKAAKGGHLRTGGFVIPADVVSHFGNGSSSAGLKLLARKVGATPIKGKGDGMSDSIPTTIDGRQKALVANDEAYVSPEQVARIGGGDAKKGAKKLRAMMDQIRHARTGSKEQGKKIDPSKFMPGGAVKRYESGGTTASGVGSAAAAGVTGTESNLSNWAGPYVTDMLAKGQALSEMPYEAYTGDLTAGPSALQTQAFNTATGLTTPSAIGNAANTAGNISAQLQGTSKYTPNTFTNQFSAPDAYTTGTFDNQFKAPGAYTAGTFDTGTFDTAAAQQYMNPYVQTALNPQLEELQRQNQIATMGDLSKMTRAGAYGGSRQGVLQAENIRNLMDKINQVTGQGYSTAFDKAQAQFNADQARQMEAQKAAEASRQFGAQQGLTAAQSAAQYGLSAQQAAEASRQFGAQQGMTAAQLKAQYGQTAADAAERAKEFGATFGQQGLQAALQAAQAQGNLGALQSQTDISNLKALSDLGAQQRAIDAEDVAAQKAAFEEARANPYKMVQFQQSLLSGLPLAAQTYNMAPTNNLSQFASGSTAMDAILKALTNENP